jgi:hypothetical protein
MGLEWVKILCSNKLITLSLYLTLYSPPSQLFSIAAVCHESIHLQAPTTISCHCSNISCPYLTAIFITVTWNIKCSWTLIQLHSLFIAVCSDIYRATIKYCIIANFYSQTFMGINWGCHYISEFVLTWLFMW